MLTEIFSATSLDKAAFLLKTGELVAFPTETVYGLGASIDHESAIERIFVAKGRPSDNPLIVHIAERDDLEKIVVDIPKEARALTEAFFPGPLTLVLPSRERVPLQARAGLPFVAVRMPSLPLTRELIRLVGTPLVAPSANLSGKPSATTAGHVLEDLGGKIAAIIDGGATTLGIESTVLSLHDGPLILRPGSITPEQIEAVLGCPVKVASGVKEQGAVLSPGMKYRHYAPDAHVRLVFSKELFDRERAASREHSILFCENCSPEQLYDILRQADRQQREQIVIYCNEEQQKDLALMNRLSRAALR